MSIEKIQLRKLLRLFYATDPKRRSILRADIYGDIKKEADEDEDEDGGGDFHVPFWADAKRHVDGAVDLLSQTKMRIEKNERRRNLYPQLAAGFLKWWNEKRRWRNEKFIFIKDVKGRVQFPKLNGIVRVENLLPLRIDGQFARIVYPYFSDVPVLPDEGARLGLWLMHEALPNYPLEDLRLLDVLRSKSFGIIDVPLHGDERHLFEVKYESVLSEWKKLKDKK